MTAINKINYYKTNMYRSNRNNSIIGMAAKALGADSSSILSLLSRLLELHESNVPTLVEISGIENGYLSNKGRVDRLFKFLSFFSRHHKKVKFAVMVGNVRYML